MWLARSLPRAVFLLAALFCAPQLSSIAQQTAQDAADSTAPIFRSTVRRVVLDVVVTDRAGQPVKGLTKEDFTLNEDGKPQQILSFEGYGFDQGMDYLPPKLPPQPPNTFVNLPPTPEKGPLYVLLYDLVNMDNPDQMTTPGDHSTQMFARQQLVKFIESKPEGSRFAIFARSDGLHLIQGFTSDKAQLFAAINPHSSRPHIPEVFTMGPNFGQGDVQSALHVLNYIATYLDGLPGRKNLIWFSSAFPLTLFPTQDDVPSYADQIKNTLDTLARDQIAIYPVDARGVVVGNAHAPTGDTGGGGMSSDSRDKGLGGTHAAAASASGGTDGGQGVSMLSASYAVQDQIARDTGGRAFHSTNDMAAALTDATSNGEAYYTLTYSPSNRDYNGKLRKISVQLAKKGYSLQYRRAYYGGTDDPATANRLKASAAPAQPPARKPGDTLYANMEHGAPIAHQVVFSTHIHPVGTPAQGTPEQMAELATQPAFFKQRRHNAPAKPLPPIQLQKFAIDYTILARSLPSAGEGVPPALEIAAAAYDADGRMLNAVVSNATSESTATPTATRKTFRAEQQLEVPLNAVSLRVAVRDTNTDRVGAMEIKLPLSPENESATAPANPGQAPPAKLN